MQNIVLTHNMYTKPTYLHYIIHILVVHVIYKVKKKKKKVSANQKRASEKREEPERGVSHSYSCADWLEGWLIGGARKAPTVPSPYWQFYSSSIDEEFSLAKTRTSIYV